MKFSGGYYLAEITSPKEWMDISILPAKFVKPSNCVCRLFPDATILTGPQTVNPSEDREREKMRDWLGMPLDEFERLCGYVQCLWDLGKVAYESLIPDLGTARRLAKIVIEQDTKVKLLSLPTVKLLEISTDESSRDELVERFTSKQDSEIGMLLKVERSSEDQSSSMGFDILGYQSSGFCSFLCQHCASLNRELAEHGFCLNGNAMFDTQEEAGAALRFMKDLKEFGKALDDEPLWQIWEIHEYRLDG